MNRNVFVLYIPQKGPLYLNLKLNMSQPLDIASLDNSFLCVLERNSVIIKKLSYRNRIIYTDLCVAVKTTLWWSSSRLKSNTTIPAVFSSAFNACKLYIKARSTSNNKVIVFYSLLYMLVELTCLYIRLRP